MLEFDNNIMGAHHMIEDMIDCLYEIVQKVVANNNNNNSHISFTTIIQNTFFNLHRPLDPIK